MQINNTTKKHRTVKKAYPYLSSPYKQLVLQDCKLEVTFTERHYTRILIYMK